jgi:two-component system response regulator AtoC
MASKSFENGYENVAGIGRVMIVSAGMQTVVGLAKLLHGDRSVPVIIDGETGTGKEIIARMIHYGEKAQSPAPFITVNCSAITPTLFESELFGYEEGSFTDARKRGMKGKFELSQGGTLFLDEIGDLPLDMQPKLLRALEERKIYRIGGAKEIELDVRIICATNRDLEKMVQEGSFRRDLFFRLNIGRIHIPPLRERREAITPLALLFLDRFSREKSKAFKFIHKEAAKILQDHEWRGNVRELQNTIERVVLLYNDEEVRSEHLTFLTCGEAPDPSASQIKPGHLILPPDHLDLKELEGEIVRKALRMFNGNKSRTAAYLGLSRSALRSRLH